MPAKMRHIPKRASAAIALSLVGSGEILQLSRPARCGRCESQNVGGGRHDCAMSYIHITDGDTCMVFGAWFLIKAPLVYVNPSAHLR